MSDPEEGRSGSGGMWLAVIVLSLFCLLVRSQRLLALPLFGDEAIYLRWAQLIRAGHAWISLIDPKPPLHFWLLACMGMYRDPLQGARMLSVLAGVLSVPALFGVCCECGYLGRGERVSGRVAGLIAALMMIFCPYVAFYQRLGTADALFIAEMLGAIWMALRWGRETGRAGGRGSWGWAAAMGVVMGLTMMTRQGLSYCLWAIPVAAAVLHWSRERKSRWWEPAVQLLVAGIIAAAIWVPFLTAELSKFAAERGGTVAELKTRILYQQNFTEAQNRAAIIWRNAEAAFAPTWENGIPAGGWFLFYMTWPLYVVSLGGFLWLAIRRQWRVLVLLGVWGAVMIGVPICMANVLYSRYLVAGVLPLLVSGAFFWAELMGLALSLRKGTGWIVIAAMFVAILVLPLREMGRQAGQWWEQTLTAADRYGYVTGWTNGLATERAIGFIMGLAPSGPVVVITDAGWGLPADGMWVYLQHTPNVSLYYTSTAEEGPILRAVPGAPPNTYLLRKDKWLYTPAEPVTLPGGQPGEGAPVILYVTNDPMYTGSGPVAAETVLSRFNPNLTLVETFYGIDKNSDHVQLFELR